MPTGESINYTAAQICNLVRDKIPVSFSQRGFGIKPDQQFLAVLASAANKAASPSQVQNIVRDQDGKTIIANIRYNQRTCPDSPDPVLNICGPGQEKEFRFAKAFVRYRVAGERWKFNAAQMRTFCETKDQYMTDTMLQEIDSLRSRVSRFLVHLARTGTNHTGGSYIGNFANGQPGGKNIPLFHTGAAPNSGNRINTAGEFVISQDMRRADIAGQKPILIGANLLEAYKDTKEISGMSDAGTDASRLTMASNIVIDPMIDVDYGNTTNIWALMPGALQLLTYAKNVGEYRYLGTTQIRDTMPDPVLPGVVYDWVMDVKECGEDLEWTWQPFIQLDLWGYPDDLFGLGCSISGVKDFFWYKGVCADTNMCDVVTANSPDQPVANVVVERTGNILTITTTSTPAAANYEIDLGGTAPLFGPPADPLVSPPAGVTGTYGVITVDLDVYNLEIDEICVDTYLSSGVKSIGDCALVPSA